MVNLLEAVIGWVAPPQCISCGVEGTALCAACSTAEIIPYGERCWSCGAASQLGRTCPSCRKSAPRYVWISTSYEDTAKKLINVYKFSGRRVAGSSLAQVMSQTLGDFLTQAELTKLNYLIIPIPTATSRQRQRGFDHGKLLAKFLSRQTGLKTIDALGRLGQTRQLGARRDVRLKQAEGKYYVRLPYLIKGRNILLVDDVVTTGATLRGATKTLRQAGARRVDALIFAKRL